VFSGLPGTGKSHLAAAIMISLIDGKRQVQYVACMAMIRAVRDTWRKGAEQSERSVIAHFGTTVDLLVIDEVGVQYGSDSEQTILFEILDRRYSEMRPTILLTNQDKAGFKSLVGDRVFDRLSETCRWVAFDWESYRPTARRETST
jgi:DNA replication protein DnaC